MTKHLTLNVQKVLIKRQFSGMGFWVEKIRLHGIQHIKIKNTVLTPKKKEKASLFHDTINGNCALFSYLGNFKESKLAVMVGLCCRAAVSVMPQMLKQDQEEFIFKKRKREREKKEIRETSTCHLTSRTQTYQNREKEPVCTLWVRDNGKHSL